MSPTPLKSVLVVAATLLFTSSLALAQQAQTADAATPAKTKIKTKRSKSAQVAPLPGGAGAPLAPAGGTPPPPPGGPQPPRPGAGPGGPGPGGPGVGPGPHQGGAQALTDYRGTLTEYLAGDDQVYDAFTLKTSSGSETVRFPRHLGQRLMAAAKAGNTVTVTGFRDTDPQGRVALHLVSVTAGSQIISNTPPTPPTTPPTEESTTAQGIVQRLAQDPHGRTNALVLNNGTIVHISPDAAAQLSEKLKVGATVAASGTLRPTVPGEVTAKPVRVVRAQTLTLDGVQFLVR